MELKSTFIFNGVRIDLEPGLIKVYSDEALWSFLKNKEATKLIALISEIKAAYLQQFGSPLRITDSSLLVEILVHVHCHYLLLKLVNRINLSSLKSILVKLIKRAEVADCGEKEKDTNRWFWDFSSFFKAIVVGIFPKSLL